jgi:hypothetical protein
MSMKMIVTVGDAPHPPSGHLIPASGEKEE